MLTLNIKDHEYYNEELEVFLEISGGTYSFEHSLYSISQWESIWQKPFFNTELKGYELLSYIECMCLDDNFNSEIINNTVIKEVSDYLSVVPSATTIQNGNNSGGSGGQVMTSELLYAYMVEQRIPFEAEKWNIWRLMKLLNILAIRSSDPKKMNKNDILRQNKSLNEQRKKELNTKG